ncbi:HlyD family efflux transporter periplasmic adaptor subunit [Roseovarius sp.]|uniref:efflux RND transporter periplasmic adaptor subunit n=1 Tax=Roseovarius sp. TaxID=1486281 RepID=UPI00261C5B2F|nr:HlyD family efflux transporter periplasmic adaptor subunit [Roseovarius sp.]MDM8164406.1 efflux transporter periplasmic adaptor subunit [Roseovarius sp.]
MRFLRQSLTGLLLLSLTLGLLVYAGQIVFSAVQERMADEPRVPERRERVFAVNVVEAREQTITPELTAYGEIQSRRTLEIRARTTGTLVTLADNFEEGGVVEAGQLLAQVDPADAEFALNRAESELTDAQAEKKEAVRGLELAQDELEAAEEQATLQEKAYQRQVDLEDRGVGTSAAVETAELAAAQARQAVIARRQALAVAEARIDQADTSLARARIAFDEAERQLADTRIVAGFSGTLSDVSVVEGGLVSANEQLGTLVDGNALEVSFRVSTPQYGRLLDETGSLLKAPVSAYLSAYGLDLEARGVISRESAAVGEGTTGRLLFARLYEAPAMKPGDFVTVRIEEPSLERLVRLPASSLGPSGTVLVLDEENRLKTLQVEVLRRQGDDILVRGEGLPGARVVVERTPLLGEGIRVRPLTSGVQEEPEADPSTLELSAARRERLMEFVEASADMSDEVKRRLLGQLEQERVPARVVERLERRMGG